MYCVVPFGTAIDKPVSEILLGDALVADVMFVVIPVEVVPVYKFAVSCEPDPFFMYAEKVMLVIVRLFPAVGVTGNST